MTILDKIIEYKRKQIDLISQQTSLEKLIAYADKVPPCPSFKESLLATDKNGIIAEFKRKSPSKGIINSEASPSEVGIDYQDANVSAISVLTESQFFGGNNSDLTEIAQEVSIPILRKDFIIDEYQIYEARAIGASAILIIAAVLTDKKMKEFFQLATSLNLDVLFEVHNKEEISRLPINAQIIGINNRNLKTFKVDIDNSIRLAEYLSPDAIKVAESGISDKNTIELLKENCFNGFLIGETFMSKKNPGKACKDFCANL